MPVSDLPTLSVITPSFQQARFLEHTLRSVLRQGYPRLEYLVADGGSTDGSAELIRRYAPQLAWWCSERDRGQAHAINKGLEHATGQIVGWVNSDDMLLPGCLDTVARAFADESVEAVCGWGIVMSEDGRVRRRWVFPQPDAGQLQVAGGLFQPSVFWRRRVHERIGPLDESFRFCMDQELFARMAAAGIVPRLVPRFLSAYRKHGLTKTSTIGDVGRAEQARLLERVPPALVDEVRRRRPAIGARLQRLFWHKLALPLPPYARGTDVHRLFD